VSLVGHARIFVLKPDGHKITGFHALNAHSIDYRELPASFARDRPASGFIPAAFIAMIAAAKSEQDMGYGDDLLGDAMKRNAEARRSLDVSIAVLDYGEAMARRMTLYASDGFEPFAERALRMWISVRAL
jgi:hypothetical protein